MANNKAEKDRPFQPFTLLLVETLYNDQKSSNTDVQLQVSVTLLFALLSLLLMKRIYLIYLYGSLSLFFAINFASLCFCRSLRRTVGLARRPEICSELTYFFFRATAEVLSCLACMVG